MAAESEPRARLDALSAWLGDWFSELGFNGCAFINARAEWGVLRSAGHVAVDGHA
ncbi:hypothetical protein [Tomitella biformata]|uniref:hypothetical protein n=1 Tax=Tomitella biformata TaxID=630403 RepID=UPI0004BAA361|nr:hypothetical protein [Tomitella biformata]